MMDKCSDEATKQLAATKPPNICGKAYSSRYYNDFVIWNILQWTYPETKTMKHLILVLGFVALTAASDSAEQLDYHNQEDWWDLFRCSIKFTWVITMNLINDVTDIAVNEPNAQII